MTYKHYIRGVNLYEILGGKKPLLYDLLNPLTNLDSYDINHDVSDSIISFSDFVFESKLIFSVTNVHNKVDSIIIRSKFLRKIHQLIEDSMFEEQSFNDLDVFFTDFIWFNLGIKVGLDYNIIIDGI